MEKEKWIIRVTKWAWTPIILGAVVCLGTIVIADTYAIEALPAGLGIILFGWIAMIKGFVR